MEKTPMTVAGAEKLRKDLEFLKSVERPRISTAKTFWAESKNYKSLERVKKRLQLS